MKVRAFDLQELFQGFLTCREPQSINTKHHIQLPPSTRETANFFIPHNQTDDSLRQGFKTDRLTYSPVALGVTQEYHHLYRHNG